MCLCVCVFVCLCICVFVFLCICVFVCLSVNVPVCLCAYVSVFLCFCVFVCLYIYRVYEFVGMMCVCISVSLCLYVYVSVCLCICIFICVYVSILFVTFGLPQCHKVPYLAYTVWRNIWTIHRHDYRTSRTQYITSYLWTYLSQLFLSAPSNVSAFLQHIAVLILKVLTFGSTLKGPSRPPANLCRQRRFFNIFLCENLILFVCTAFCNPLFWLSEWHKLLKEQAQRRAAAGRPRHKSHGVIQYQGSYFPTRCRKWIFTILIVLVEKKHTKLIYGFLKNHQSYIEKLPKNRKNDPVNRKKWNFQKMSKVFKVLWYKILSTQISHS